MCDSTLFHIRLGPNISLFSPHRTKTTDRFEPPHRRGVLRMPAGDHWSPLQFKKYLQSHRCNRGLDRFGLAKHLKCLQSCCIINTRKEGDVLKEYMIKRFFAPIWKCDEIEVELERLENKGWRLERISGFRKFKFVKASPKATKYFFTCSFVKESGMIQTEQLLKREFKATEISGNFIEGLKTTSVYRITREADLLQRKIYRNIYLRHLVLQYILIALFFTGISVAGLILASVFGETPIFSSQNIMFAIIGICGTSSLFYHLCGWLHLQKQYAKYWSSNKE